MTSRRLCCILLVVRRRVEAPAEKQSNCKRSDGRSAENSGWTVERKLWGEPRGGSIPPGAYEGNEMRRNIENDVTFRVWKSGIHSGDVTALWPAISAGWARGQYCQSYAHIGQHGAADYSYVVNLTRPATPDEYADLLAELNDKGYEDIYVIHRATYQHHRHRTKVGICK